jgi:hypothetical protein
MTSTGDAPFRRPPQAFFPPSLNQLANRDPRALEELRRREVHLGLPNGLLLRLLESPDDWTFVLRLHALVEAAVEHLIVTGIGKPAITDFIGRLPIAGGRAGKARLGRDLGLFDAADTALIEGLSELRNAYAHEVQMVDVGLVDYFDGLNNERRVKITRWIAQSHGFLPTDDILSEARRSFRSSPRYVLWYAADRLVGRAYLEKRDLRGQQIAKEFGIATEDGRLLTTEAGVPLVREDAPDIDE